MTTNNLSDDLYSRQRSLNLTPPERVTIIGVGGIGAWIGLFLGMSGVKEIHLVDPDIIEIHNLNRTPFTLRDIGQHKVRAISRLILERRRDVKLVQHIGMYEVLPNVNKEFIIDCRDKKGAIDGTVKYAAGYNGFSVTYHRAPSYETVFGQSQGYTITPSYLVPPVLVAALIVNDICNGANNECSNNTINDGQNCGQSRGDTEYIKTFDVRTLPFCIPEQFKDYTS